MVFNKSRRFFHLAGGVLIFLLVFNIPLICQVTNNVSVDVLVEQLVQQKVSRENVGDYLKEKTVLANQCVSEDNLLAWFHLYHSSTSQLEGAGLADEAFKSLKETDGHPFRMPRDTELYEYSGFKSIYGYQLATFQGDYFGAKQYYFEALGILDKFPPDAYISRKGWLNHALGNIYSRLGDYSRARIFLDIALQLKEKDPKYSWDLAACRSDIAIILRSQNNYREAIKLIKTSLLTSDLVDSTKKLLFLELIQNETLLNENDLARKHTNELIEMFDDGVNTLLPAALLVQAGVEALQGHYQEAIVLSSQAIDSIAKYPDDHEIRVFAKAYLARADYYLEVGNAYSALINYHLALQKVIPSIPSDPYFLPQKSDLYPENIIFYALIGKATAFEKLNEESASSFYRNSELNSLKLAQKAGEKLRNEFSFDVSKLNLLKDSRRVSEMGIEAYWKAYQKNPKQEYLNDAFYFAESNKSILLFEGLREKELGYKDNVPDSTKNVITELRGSIRELFYVIAQLEGDEDIDLVSISDAKVKLSKYQEQLNILEGEWRIKASKSITNYGLERLQLVLPAETAFYEYFYGGNDVYLFVITRDKVSFNKLDKEQLDQKIKGYYHFTKLHFSDKSSLDSFYQVSQDLYKLCLEPYLQKEKRLIVVPDGKMHLVAFDGLITKMSSESQPNYLIKQHSTLYAWSSRLYQYQKEKKAKGENEVLAVFPIEFDLPNAGYFPRLAYSEEEIETISNYYPVRKLKQENATKEQFDKFWTTSNILHLSLHAGGGDQPWMAFYDKKLFLSELDGFNQGLDMVVFSACESGQGSIDHAEGPISLARGFALMGAASVVQSQWKVNEQVAVKIFGEFYHFLSKGYDKDEAMRMAKLDYLGYCSKNEHIPYFWAGIIVSGNESPLMSNLNESSQLIYYIMGIGLLGLFLFIVNKRAKKIEM